MMLTKLSANDKTGNRILKRKLILEQRIAQACHVAGRLPTDVSLLAVSKTQPIEILQAAYRAGLRQFGENYLQEALSKIDALPSDCEWHFIGPIQSNKTRQIAEAFDWVHCLSRAKIAQRLNDQRPAHLEPLKVCIQVNISHELSKAGIDCSELPELVSAVRALPRLKLMGLMCIPRADDDLSKQSAAFSQLRTLRDQHLPDAPCLSMGMSADLEMAVSQGSTLLRIGTALFGPRQSPP